MISTHYYTTKSIGIHHTFIHDNNVKNIKRNTTYIAIHLQTGNIMQEYLIYRNSASV